MKKIIFFFFFLSSVLNMTAQKTLSTVIEKAQKQNKPFIINLVLPKRLPELSPMDPIEYLDNGCFDGKCQQRIDSAFIVEDFVVNEENGKAIASKFNLKNFPVFLVFDKDGTLVTKCSYYSFAFDDEGFYKKFIPEITDKTKSQQLRDIEANMNSADAKTLQAYMTIKDNWRMSDRDLLELFVQKAVKIDYNKDIQDLILKNTSFIHTDFEKQALVNLQKYMPNYLPADDVEYEAYKLKEDYKYGVMNSLFYAYRIGNDSLFNSLISDAQKSVFKNNELDEMLEAASFMYFKAVKKPDELFKMTKPRMDSQLEKYEKSDKTDDAKIELADNLNKAAWSYYEADGRDSVQLGTVLSWTHLSNQLAPENPPYMDTYSHILFLTGKKSEAITNQKITIDLARQTYKDMLEHPQVKELIGNLEIELKKMEGGKL